MNPTKVASRLPGRLRLRGDALRQPRRNAELRTLFAGWDGVIAAEGAPATGGILLRYDPARVAPADIEARALAAVDPPPIPPQTPLAAVRVSAAHRYPIKPPAIKPVSARRLVNIGMLASMAGSLIALAYGKKLHALIGVAHLGFLALHLVDHRRKLIRDLTP